MSHVMMVDVATALVAILPLLAIRVPRPPRSTDLDRASIWAEMVAGFRYLMQRRAHRTLIAMSALINALLVPAFSLLPLLVLQRLNEGAAQFAWLTSSLGVGLIVGGMALGAWGGFRKRIVSTLVGMIALGIAVTAVGLTPASSFLWALVSTSCVGLIVPLVNGPVYAILQATIAPDYQGRVFSLVASLATAVAPLGLIVAAPVADIVGVSAWYIAGGVACVAMGVAGFFAPALMAIEDGTAATSR
jgi:DHA3 family macrolide efflux protein-like MFS transporter